MFSLMLSVCTSQIAVRLSTASVWVQPVDHFFTTSEAPARAAHTRRDQVQLVRINHKRDNPARGNTCSKSFGLRRFS